MPVPQRVDFLVERAPEPVHKKLIDNGATSQFEPTLAMRREIISPAGLWVIASLLIQLANRKNTIAQFPTLCQNFLPSPPIRRQNIV